MNPAARSMDHQDYVLGGHTGEHRKMPVDSHRSRTAECKKLASRCVRTARRKAPSAAGREDGVEGMTWREQRTDRDDKGAFLILLENTVVVT
ncbi:unnamed protein product [Lasius platythorax]|uniref:Uncharacterized protein n=1 Tax=Lasius platythorax TaxID=488582 RepID=A0AAV2MY54_9HYME